MKIAFKSVSYDQSNFTGNLFGKNLPPQLTCTFEIFEPTKEILKSLQTTENLEEFGYACLNMKQHGIPLKELKEVFPEYFL